MLSGTGICTIDANQSGNSSYNPATQQQTSAAAAKINPTLTFTEAPPSLAYQGTFTVASTTNASTSPVYTSSGACSNIAAAYKMTSGTGTCTSTVTWPADSNYNGATLKQTTTAARVNPTVTFSGAPSTASYGSSFTVAATTNASSRSAITTAGGCSVGAVSGTAASAMATATMTSGTGTCQLMASWAADLNYAAGSSSQSISAQKATLTVTANNASRIYGQPNPTFTAKYTGFANSDTQSVLSGSPSLTTAATTSSLPGTYPIVAAAGSLTAVNYSFQFVNGVLTINVTASVPSSGTSCNGAYNGTFNGNLMVTKGQTCVLVGGQVTGNITQNGGSLSIANFSVGGNLQVQGGTLSAGPGAGINGNVQIQNIPAGTPPSQVCGSTVHGNVQVQGNGAAIQIGSPPCAGNVINGNLQVQNNAGATAVFANTVGGNLQDQNNTGATQVFNNTVKGNLQCLSDSSPTGGRNTANNKEGQCAAF